MGFKKIRLIGVAVLLVTNTIAKAQELDLPESPSMDQYIAAYEGQESSGGAPYAEGGSLLGSVGMYSLSRMLRSPQMLRDFAEFARPLSNTDITAIRRVLRQRMQALPDGHRGGPLTRFSRWMRGPVVLLDADGVIIDQQGAIHNKKLMAKQPMVYGKLNAGSRTIFGRKIPFLGEPKPIGLQSAFKQYALDVRAHGGVPVVVECLTSTQTCKALVRSYGFSTTGRVKGATLLRRGSILLLFLPIVLNADAFVAMIPIGEPDIECFFDLP